MRSGAKNAPKADALAARMKEVLAGREGTRVNRPIKTAKIRLRGIEWSITAKEITEAVDVGRCHPEDVKLGEIRRTPGGRVAYGYASSS